MKFPRYGKNDGVRQLGWIEIPNWMEFHKTCSKHVQTTNQICCIRHSIKLTIQTQRVGELAGPEPRAHRAGFSGEILPSPGGEKHEKTSIFNCSTCVSFQVFLGNPWLAMTPRYLLLFSRTVFDCALRILGEIGCPHIGRNWVYILKTKSIPEAHSLAHRLSPVSTFNIPNIGHTPKSSLTQSLLETRICLVDLSKFPAQQWHTPCCW